MNMAMVNSYMIYKVLVSTKPTKNKGVIQTDFGPILIEAMIAGTGNENLSSSNGYEMQQLSGRHFFRKIGMASRKGVNLKNG